MLRSRLSLSRELRVLAQVPEGAVRFELTAEEIAEALAEESVEVAAPEDIPVPDALLPYTGGMTHVGGADT